MSEIYLLPGEFYFGNDYKVIKTLLGSCVAITMWSKRLKIGGMCHYKLPRRLHGATAELDGNYGEEALLLFMKNLNRFMLKPKDMVVGVFGAGNMFSCIVESDERSVGIKNIKLAHQLLSKKGFVIKYESLGGNVSRKISLDVGSGLVTVQRVKAG